MNQSDLSKLTQKAHDYAKNTYYKNLEYDKAKHIFLNKFLEEVKELKQAINKHLENNHKYQISELIKLRDKSKFKIA